MIPTVTPDISVGQDGALAFGGINTLQLIEKYGSPLFVMSEDRIRQNCRFHKQMLNKYFGGNSHVAFASKAMSCRQIYRILADEDMYADVVSPGELYTAVSAGFDASHLIFHGNNKTPDDIRFAIDRGLGLFAADNMYELDNISRIATERGIQQSVILRVTPGIDPHTHEKINTGKIDSKFGSPIGNGQAEDILRYALSLPGIDVAGLHYHIGSQITEAQPFCDALDNVLEFLRVMRERLGFTARIINIGGGFGIRYTEQTPLTPYDEIFSSLSDRLTAFCTAHDYAQPTIITEPGRSIVADAGITLYTVGAVKNIPGYKTYVSVDGGMTDNPRFALYSAPYLAVLANKADKPTELQCSIVGRCCESGDILIPEAALPKAEVGDIVAILNTGAYNYSMASNYNRIPRPPVIMVSGGKDYVAVRRESFEHLISLDN
ncbi:MAG: diaminopimelate decarboxylase [Clostridia bacterium]|nr:diaminopimelate decarboxylase [Clostridia bacterium]